MLSCSSTVAEEDASILRVKLGQTGKVLEHNNHDLIEKAIFLRDRTDFMGDRDLINRIVTVLAVVLVLTGYAVPWIHLEGESALGYISGWFKISIFTWGFSGYHPPTIFGERAEEFSFLWVQNLQPSPSLVRALSFLGWFAPRGEYLFAGSFVFYFLATMVFLFRLSGKGKKARMAIYACGLLLASLLLFLTGVEDAITSSRLHVRAFSWEAGIYVCAISFILAAFSWHHSRAVHTAMEGVGPKSQIANTARNEGVSGSAKKDRSV